MISNFRVLSACTLLSRVLGLIRDMALAAVFGAGPVLDAFIVAFRLPNLSRQLLGEGALSTAFLPVFVQDLEQHGKSAARQTLTAVACTVTVLLSLLVLVGEAGLLAMWAMLPATSEARLVVAYLVVLLPYMICICLAALLSAALHGLRQFLWPGLVPVALNLLWLLALGGAVLTVQDDHDRALLMCAGIVLAGIVQLLIPIWALRRCGWQFTRPAPESWSRVSAVFQAVLPVVAGIGLTQVGTVFDSVLAWSLADAGPEGTAVCELWGWNPVLPAGTASGLYLGQRLYQFPLGVFGVALGTVLFPVLTQHAARRDYGALRTDLTFGLRLVAAIAIPASVGLMLLAGPVTQLLFQRGRFDADDARLAAQLIAIYGAGVWIFIGLLIVNRAFYAIGERMVPMKLGLLALVFNIVFDLIFVWSLGGSALAVGGVLAAGLQLGLSVINLQLLTGPLDWQRLAQVTLRVCAATGVMIAAVLLSNSLVPVADSLTARLARLILPLALGGISYLLASYLFGISEVWALLQREAPETAVDPAPAAVAVAEDADQHG